VKPLVEGGAFPRHTFLLVSVLARVLARVLVVVLVLVLVLGGWCWSRTCALLATTRRRRSMVARLLPLPLAHAGSSHTKASGGGGATHHGLRGGRI